MRSGVNKNAVTYMWNIIAHKITLEHIQCNGFVVLFSIIQRKHENKIKPLFLMNFLKLVESANFLTV
jgi:hypothetical protein